MLKRFINSVIEGAGLLGTVFFLGAFLISGLLGPGAVVAIIEKPFGAGPWGHTGSYCMKISATNSDIVSALGTNPPPDIAQRVQTDVANLIRTAPDHQIKVQYARWAMGQSIQDIVMVRSASRAINQWTQKSCNTFDIKFPAWLNSFYNGLLGPGFGSMFRLPGT